MKVVCNIVCTCGDIIEGKLEGRFADHKLGAQFKSEAMKTIR